jgi:UDP-glucose 4-epimerase
VRVFVTGGAGYVGSHCVKRLLSAGHQVTVFDDLSTGHRQAIPAGAEFIPGDLADADRLTALLQAGGFEAVMHFAARVDVGESVREPLRYYRSNVVYSLNLLEAMRAAGIRKLVFSSSCAVYGVPPALPITEQMPRQPISPYGATKVVVEWMLEHSALAWGLGAVALRYFNAAGAAADGSLGEDHRPELHLIPLILQVALGRSEAVSVYGADYPTRDGTCVRDFVHVDDLAEAHLLALEKLEAGRFEAFNVGTGRGATVLEVIEAARLVTGQAIPARIVSRRPGDPPELYASSDKIRRELGWKPRYVDVRRIVATAWAWHRAHPDGYVE